MMPRQIIRTLLVIVTCIAGCDYSTDNYRADDYVAVSSLSRNGFARNKAALSDLQGQEIQLWGFVDHQNL